MMIRSLTLRRPAAALLVLLLVWQLALPVGAATSAAVAEAADKAAAWVTNAVPEPQVGSVGGEWAVLGLARGDRLPQGYAQGYYDRLAAALTAAEGKLSATKMTEYARVILALTAVGRDPTNVAGYDLLAPLAHEDRVLRQGINGAIWALIALDGGNYPIPTAPQGTTQATRAGYVAAILQRQLPGGGWSLTGQAPADPDITGMALQALSRHRQEAGVEEAVTAALAWLSQAQRDNGDWSDQGVESVAQVTVALCALGVPLTDAAFVKNGSSPVDALLAWQQPDGSFARGGDANLMSGEQGLYALVAVTRAQEGKTALYDMSDVPRATFSDVEGLRESAAILALTQEGIINGMGDGTFAPHEGMTRAQFAAIVVRGLGLTGQTTAAFADVPAAAWYAPYVGAAHAAGLVSGVGEGNFAPEAAITRQEAATLVARAAAVGGADTQVSPERVATALAPFTDGDAVADWAGEGLAYCLQTALWDLPGETLQPQTPILRREIAQMVWLLLTQTETL